MSLITQQSKSFYLFKMMPYFKKSLWANACIFILIIPIFPGCEKSTDAIRNWGIQQRDRRMQQMQSGHLKKWERDLNLSRARVKKLNGRIQDLVRESNLQGRLSWKIARAFCDQGRYEAGAAFARAAVRNKSPGTVLNRELSYFEKSLPYFKTSLQLARLEPGLLFDAGLCYANASRALGWEADRFKVAVFLFERMYKSDPADTRPLYQLALLYAKTSNRKLRDQARAVKLLQHILKSDDLNIAARFALAHILTESGKFHEALREYRLVREKLTELKKRGNLAGELKHNRQFKVAGKNADKLEICVKENRGCEIHKTR